MHKNFEILQLKDKNDDMFNCCLYYASVANSGRRFLWLLNNPDTQILPPEQSLISNNARKQENFTAESSPSAERSALRTPDVRKECEDWGVFASEFDFPNDVSQWRHERGSE